MKKRVIQKCVTLHNVVIDFEHHQNGINPGEYIHHEQAYTPHHPFFILRDEGLTYDTRFSVEQDSELHSDLLFDNYQVEQVVFQQQNDDGGNKVVDMESNPRS